MKIIFFIIIVHISVLYAQEPHAKRKAKYKYTFVEREISISEMAKLQGYVFLAAWPAYYLTQPKTFEEEGSWDNYKSNFGKIVFDKDDPIWNWVVHPISGAQLYLFYRANGLGKIQAIQMSAITSTMFEFLIEIYTEPASIQDLYQTPVIGPILGLGLEKMSFYLLNTGNPAAKILGHILNPSTLFWFYEGKISILPALNPSKDSIGLNLYMDF